MNGSPAQGPTSSDSSIPCRMSRRAGMAQIEPWPEDCGLEYVRGVLSATLPLLPGLGPETTIVAVMVYDWM